MKTHPSRNTGGPKSKVAIYRRRRRVWAACECLEKRTLLSAAPAASSEPTVQFSITSESVDESADSFSITVNQSATSGVETVIPFTLGGTAVTGTDFSDVSASPLVIAAGQTSATITGTLRLDAGNSSTLTFSLGTPINATLGANAANTLTITQPTGTTTQEEFSASSVVFGQPLFITTTVTPNSGSAVASGLVTLLVDGSPFGGFQPINNAGNFTFTVSGLSAGQHAIEADFVGDSNFAGSESTEMFETVNKANTNTALTGAANFAVFGQPIKFRATVSAISPGAGIPTGSVSLVDELTGDTLGFANVNTSGVAKITISSFAVGSSTILAFYSGGGNFNGSQSGSFTESITQAASATALTSSANPANFHHSVTLVATVSALSPGSGLPTGTVEFKDGSTDLGTGTLSGGVARFTTSSLSFASHSITAAFLASANFSSSTSQALILTERISTGVSFAPQAIFSVGSAPTGVAVGDFNGDGKLDIVTANQYGSSVSLLLGRGDGTFFAQRTVYGSQEPVSLAVGDFNGDGKLDLAVVERQSGSVDLFLGNGDGTFKPKTTFTVGASPQSVAVGDFNNDGKLDLAVANFGDGTVSILAGNGDGTFKPQMTFSAAAAAFVTAGDFNSDGKLDLVVANYNAGSETIMLGNGDGTFHSGSTASVGSDPQKGVVGDFNHDGKLDLAVPNYGSGTVSILLGNGNGTFKPQATVGVGSAPTSAAAGDFNGDGLLDLAVSNFRGNSESILLGNGDGTFQPQVIEAVGKDPGSAAVGDFNGDGKMDLAIANEQGGTVSLLLNTGYGSGGGVFGAQTTFGTGNNPEAAVVGDFNGDGKLDLAVANQDSNSVSILLGNGNGTFKPGGDFGVGAYPVAVAVGDFNGDGKLDLAVTSIQDNTVNIRLGNGDGTFKQQIRVNVGGYPISVAVGDFNGDGKLDLAVANETDNTVGILLGNGNGMFKPQATFATGNYPKSVVVGDFNGDGKLDLAVANQNDNTVSILLGNGDEMFKTQIASGAGNAPRSLAVGDFNNDGKLDVAAVNSNAMSILLGNGDGLFQPPSSIAASDLYSVTAADFNDDGNLDLAVVDQRSGFVSVLAGNGDGTFAAGVASTVGATPIFAAVGDFNGDGAADLAVTNNTGNTVSVLLNDIPPIITSASQATFLAGIPGTFTVDTLDRPVAMISESGNLPSGVTFIDNSDGTATLSGTPAAGITGVFNFTIKAKNGVSPKSMQTFTLTVNAPTPPMITSINAATFTTGMAGTFTVTASGNPTPAISDIVSVPSLPSGVSFVDNGNGSATLSGTPAAGTGGAYLLTLRAKNGAKPNSTQMFTLTVDQAPAITSAGTATFTVNASRKFTVKTTGFPIAAITEVGGLPLGITFIDEGNGKAQFSGSPLAGTEGPYTIMLKAVNRVNPRALQTFMLMVNAPPLGAPPAAAAMNATISRPDLTVGGGISADALILSGAGDDTVLG